MTRQIRGILIMAALLVSQFIIIPLLILAPAGLFSDPVSEEGSAVMEGFRVTAYCPGPCCNGHWAGMTATGKPISYYISHGMNIAAVDPGVIPLGSIINFNGRLFHAVDVGGSVRGRHIDILVLRHEDTTRFGNRREQTIRIYRTGTPAWQCLSMGLLRHGSDEN